mgnify:CR=1 FL=1
MSKAATKTVGFGSLRSRLIISVAILQTGLIAVFLLESIFRQRELILDNQSQEAIALAEALSVTASSWLSSNDVAGLQELLDAQSQFPELIFAVLTDEFGQIKAHTDRSKIGLYVLDLPQKAELTTITKSPELVDIAIPSRLSGKHVGWVRIGLGQKRAAEQLSLITQTGIIYGVLAILVGSGVVWLLGSYITRRLYVVQNTINQVASGNPGARANIQGNDEAAVIAREFNNLLDAQEKSDWELQKNIKALEDYKFALDQSAAITITDEEGIIISANDNLCNISKYTCEELIGKTVKVLSSDFHPNSFFREMWDTIRSGKVWIGEFKNRKKDGEFFWVRSTIIPFLDADQKPFQYLSIHYDITEKKRIEEEIIKAKEMAEQNESRLKLAAASGKLGIWDWNIPDDVISWDDRMYELIGIEKGGNENKFETWVNSLHPDDKAKAKAEVQAAIHGNKKFDTSFRIVKPSGEIAYIKADALILKDSSGNPLRMIGINQDITERINTINTLQKMNIAVGERVKELNCLYRISEISKKAGFSVDDIMSQSAHIITTAYQYTEITSARITFQDKVYLSDQFKESPWSQSADIYTNKVKSGVVEVFYSEEKPGEDEGPFLKEERLLINSVADILGSAVELKESEFTLQASEEKYRYLFHNNPALIIIWDLEALEVLEVNQQIIDLYGYTREEFIGMPVFQYRPKEDYDAIRNFAKKMLEGNEPIAKRTWTHLKKNGEEMIMDISSHKITYQNRKAILSLGRDVTEQIKAERELIKSEEKHRALIENISDGIVLVDADFKLLYQSPSVERIVGYALEDRKGKVALDFIHPDDLQLTIQQYENAKSNPGVPFQSQYRTRHKNGGYIWIEVSVINLLDLASVQSYVVIYRDITERKKFEEQLALSALIVNSSDDAIISKSVDGRITSWNHGAEKVLGYTAEEAIGQSIFLLISPDLHEEEFMISESIKNGKSVDHYETLRITKDGRAINVSLTVSPIMDESGQVIGASKIIRDITEQKVMELERDKIMNELIQRNRDLEQFSYIVSHNLRAPVANIIGISDFMLKSGLNPVKKEQLEVGLGKSVHALDVVIKDLNQILQSKREISEQTSLVKFSGLLEAIKLSIANLIKKERVQFVIDFSEVDEMITLKSYLYSVFYNLISNSIKYRQPHIGPVIEIQSKLTATGIEIIFKDNGLGIDLKHKGDQVFGLYKRFHSHTEGKGMGLYMVKTQVETLGGKITVESEVNKGTMFKIEFEHVKK